MTIYDLSLQAQRLLEHLRQHGTSSTKELENNCAIRHPDTIVSRIRKAFGPEVIKGQWRNGRNKFGEPTRFMMYSLTKEGREKIFPVKKPFPAWINAIQRT